VCTVRDSRGDDEMAACGQLGGIGLPFRCVLQGWDPAHVAGRGGVGVSLGPPPWAGPWPADGVWGAASGGSSKSSSIAPRPSHAHACSMGEGVTPKWVTCGRCPCCASPGPPWRLTSPPGGFGGAPRPTCAHAACLVCREVPLLEPPPRFQAILQEQQRERSLQAAA
jgi:hypothetical protein